MQRGNQAVTGGVFVQRQQVAGALTAQNPLVLLEFFEHVTVTHLGAHKMHAAGLERHLHRHIGHQRADHAGHMFIAPKPVIGHQVQQLIAVVEAPVRIDQLQPVGVAVQRHTVVRVVGKHRLDQGQRVRRTHLVVDVEAVRGATDGNHFGTQLVEHHGRNVVSGPVCGVHRDLEAFEREVVGEAALAELDVAPGRVLEPPGLAQRSRIRPYRRFSQGRLHRQFPGIGQLGTLGAEELDAVVGKRVVAGADDHTQRGALGTGQVSHARRRQRAQQHHVHTGRVEAAFQRAFEHVARNAGVLADQHGGPGLELFEYPAHRVRQTQYKVGRNRRLANRATNAVGAKVFSCHFFPSVFQRCRTR